MKTGGFSYTRVMILSRFVFILFTLLLVATFLSLNAAGRTRFSLGYPDLAGLADVDLGGFQFGLARFKGNRVGLGFGLGDSRSFSFGNWKLSPFLAGTFSSQGLEPGDFTGGMKSRYFDYRIGSWAIRSSSCASVTTSAYSLSGNGSFTLGNLSLAYDLQYGYGSEGEFWFPVRDSSYWTSLFRGNIPGFENLSTDYLTLYGERRISLGEESFKWSQGIILDSQGNAGTLGLVTRLEYRDSFFLAKFNEMEVDGWALQMSGDQLSIGFLETSGDRGKYGISLGLKGERNFGLAITGKKYDSEMAVDLTVRW